jgi:hypothetical protein
MQPAAVRLANRVIFLLAAAWPLSAHADVWNASTDFTVGFARGVWSYGYVRYPVLGSSSRDLPALPQFKPMNVYVDDFPLIQFWVEDDDGGKARIARLRLEDRLVMVTGMTDSQEMVAPVVRWTAPHDGRFEVSADYSYLDESLGSEFLSQVGLSIEGNMVESSLLEAVGETAAVRRVVDLGVGQHLDFFVTRGPHKVAMFVRVTDVPEPDSWPLLAIGGAVILARSRRHWRTNWRPTR